MEIHHHRSSLYLGTGLLHGDGFTGIDVHRVLAIFTHVWSRGNSLCATTHCGRWHSELTQSYCRNTAGFVFGRPVCWTNGFPPEPNVDSRRFCAPLDRYHLVGEPSRSREHEVPSSQIYFLQHRWFLRCLVVCFRNRFSDVW